MAHLVITLKEKLIGEYPIDKDKLSIGRKPSNDICLNHLAVSGHHSQIITVLDSSFLEDLNSTNGTYVNSRLVKKHALEDGDLINIGDYRIKFSNEQGEIEEEFDDDILEQTILLSPGKDFDPLEIPLPSRQKEAPKVIKEPQGNLQVLNGKSAGLILNLEKSLTTFGLPKIAIAGITKRGNKHFLVHVQGSKENMTLLNGEPVQKKATLLEENDIIEVAEVKLEFFIQ